mmetsp:Transcript_25140/g.52069  ORF Transcript_25140/g.52069 Transcript_25140/m.52069 type:complete len:349 (+) Transcript_25140:249-1295(+)
MTSATTSTNHAQQLTQPLPHRHVILQRRPKGIIPQTIRQILPQCIPRLVIVAQPQITPNDVLQQPHRRTEDQTPDHVIEHGAHGVEPFGSGAHVRQADFVEEYLLHDEGGDGLAEFGPRLHDAEAERYDFRLEQKVDDVGIVHFDQGADDSQGGETEVLEGAGFGLGVEEGVEVEGDVGREEESAGVGVGGHALEEGQGVAHPVGGVGREGRGGEEGVDADDFLEEGGDGAVGVPEDGGQVGEVLAVFGQFEEDALALLGVDELQDEDVEFFDRAGVDGAGGVGGGGAGGEGGGGGGVGQGHGGGHAAAAADAEGSEAAEVVEVVEVRRAGGAADGELQLGGAAAEDG